MSPEQFDHLLSLVKNGIKTTQFQEAKIAGARLAITSKLIASSETRKLLSHSFHKRKATLYKIISETCDAIYEVLKELYLKSPSSTEG